MLGIAPRASRTPRSRLLSKGRKLRQPRLFSRSSKYQDAPKNLKLDGKASNVENTTTTTTLATGSPSSTRTLSLYSSQILNILGYPGRLYNSAQNRRPLWTQFFTSIVIYFCGDLSTQYVRRPQATAQNTETTQPATTAAATTAAAKGDNDNVTASTSPPAAAGGFFSTVYDPTRSLRNIIIGGISSIPSYTWFIYLGTLFNFPNSVALSLGAKVILNQIVFTPIFNSYFFGMQSLLAGVLPSKTTTGDLAGGGGGVVVVGTSALEDPLQAFREAGVRVWETVPTSWYNSCFFWPFVTAFNYRFVPARNRSAFAGVVAVGWQTYLGLLNQRAVEKEAKALAVDDRQYK